MARGWLLCLVLVCFLAFGAFAEDRSIEAILQDAWTQHQAYLSAGKYVSAPNTAQTELRAHKCVHDELMREPTRREHFRAMRARHDLDILQKSPAYQEEVARRKRQTTSQPIRFYSDTRLLDSTNDASTCYQAGDTVSSYQQSGQTITCQSGALLTDSSRNYLKLTVIPTTVSTFQSLLNVVRRTAPLVVAASDLCSSLPASFATSANNVDYYMFFGARAVSDPSTIATAEACSQDPVSGAPFVGSVNFNPGSFQSMPSNFFEFKQSLRIAIHEFTHALGFSSGLFGSFKDPSGVAWPASAFPTGGVATPRVLAWASNHFNCPTLAAMPLEDDGGAGTARSHWEQAAVYDEYMVGIATQFFPISNLTLSLLADSGWYSPDFSKGEDLGWGWQKGCQFLDRSCTDASWNVLGPTEAYECTGTSRGCTADRLAVGVCTATISDQSITMPGCNFYSTQSPATYCQANGTKSDPIFSDFYCPQCRCFDVRNAASSTSAACYQTQCIAGANGTRTLQIQHENTWHDCPPDGSAGSFQVDSSIPGLKTTIYCPAAIEICHYVGINSAFLVPFKSNVGYKWLFTNNSLVFWGIVAAVIVVGIIGICIFMCLCSAFCSCLCGGGNKPRNRALMLRR